MKPLSYAVLTAVALLAAPPAQAQVVVQESKDEVRPIEFNLGAELGIPLGDSADRFNVGWGFTAGLTFNPSKWWGVQAEYQFSWYDVNTEELALQGIDGNHYLHYGDLNIIARPYQGDRLGMYVLGGGGLYYRRVTLTQVTGVAAVPFCDPWLLFCSTTAVATEDVLASRDSWDFGLDAGIGATFGMSDMARLYLEVRYHYIFGPEFTDVTGAKRTADGQYLPIILGVKF